jgi:hypothetical protein
MRCLLNRRTVASLVVLLFGSTPAVAQSAGTADSLHLGAEVTTVVSGGDWKVRERHGTIRVIELSEGWEEIRYRIVVQWLEMDSERHSIRVVRSVSLNNVAPDWYSLASPSLITRNDHLMLAVKGAREPMQNVESRLMFLIGPPGELRRVPSH